MVIILLLCLLGIAIVSFAPLKTLLERNYFPKLTCVINSNDGLSILNLSTLVGSNRPTLVVGV